MRYILDSAQMKQVDTYSIEQIGIPSVVLMERAALSVTNRILELAGYERESMGKSKSATVGNTLLKVLCVCGKGNNGADGMAVARQLNELGIDVSVQVIGNAAHGGTEEFRLQRKVVENLGIRIENGLENSLENQEYNVIVDAVFGIGLSRDIEGVYQDAVDQINARKAEQKDRVLIVALDIPSGVNGSSAQIQGCAVKADVTVTFGYEKLGMMLYPGRAYCGKIYIENAGFAPDAVNNIQNYAYTYGTDDIKIIGRRSPDSNKGTYGKVLIVAGSEHMGGAACMSAKSAYKSGCGLVKVLTHVNNYNAVLGHVPEAVLETYTSQEPKGALKEKLLRSVQWADVIVAGPGISMCQEAECMVEALLTKMQEDAGEKVYILDADALNLIAANKLLMEKMNNAASRGVRIIITPHMGEMARMTGRTIQEIKKEPVKYAKTVAESGIICVLKDARTVVADAINTYINSSGNSGMATAGSGDVLTGVLAGMVQAGCYVNEQKLPLSYAAALGVFCHGRAGDFAAAKIGEAGMTAMDIAEYIPQVFMRYESE